MRSSTRKAHWLGLVSGLVLTGGMVLQAQAISPSSIHEAATSGPAPVLAYSTYLGGTQGDVALAIAVDASGSTYVTGYTGSIDFPAANPLQPAPGGTDAFVTKFDSAGRPVYSIYLGGSESDAGFGISVDTAGNAYVAGSTYSRDFPRKSSLPPSPPRAPGEPYYGDVFVAKLDPSGSLVYSAAFGGSASDGGLAIAVDDQGHAYVAGITQSVDFPVVQALQPSRRGTSDGFVAKLAPSGSALVFSTYLGGSYLEEVNSIAVDPTGSIHVAGSTISSDFPLANAIQTTSHGGPEGFVAKLRPTGSSFVYSTYLGGSDNDVLLAAAADRAGNTYVAGYTRSPDFLMVNAFQPVLGGDADIFVTKLSPTGAVAYSTYLGGSSSETAQEIAVDSSGSAFVAGQAYSNDFPLRDPIQSDCLNDGGSCCELCQVAIVAKLAPEGTDLVYSTYLGGDDQANPVPHGDGEAALGIAVDSMGTAYVTGVTPAPDFPVVDAFQPTFGGGSSDAFLAKIVLNRPPDCAAATPSPATVWPPNGRLVPISIVGVTDPDGNPVEIEVTSIFQDEPLVRVGSPDATGIGTPAAEVRATRAGNGDGRVYRISFEARDLFGASCTGGVILCVPHDQRSDAICGDNGALVDSTRP